MKCLTLERKIPFYFSYFVESEHSDVSFATSSTPQKPSLRTVSANVIPRRPKSRLPPAYSTSLESSSIATKDIKVPGVFAVPVPMLLRLQIKVTKHSPIQQFRFFLFSGRGLDCGTIAEDEGIFKPGIPSCLVTTAHAPGICDYQNLSHAGCQTWEGWETLWTPSYEHICHAKSPSCRATWTTVGRGVRPLPLTSLVLSNHMAVAKPWYGVPRSTFPHFGRHDFLLIVARINFPFAMRLVTPTDRGTFTTSLKRCLAGWEGHLAGCNSWALTFVQQSSAKLCTIFRTPCNSSSPYSTVEILRRATMECEIDRDRLDCGQQAAGPAGLLR